MRTLGIIFIAISLLMTACGPSVRVHVYKPYAEMNQPKTGEVDIFNSFDEVGRPYKEVAELEATDGRTPDRRDKEQMMESLKARARKLGADGIVISKEGESVTKHPDPWGGGSINQSYIFIKCIAIVY